MNQILDVNKSKGLVLSIQAGSCFCKNLKAETAIFAIL
jgi:hypothetical protein